MEDKQLHTKSDHALREERILEFWKQNRIFEKTLSKQSSKGEFVFYEGPPTANGKPGIHHVEARSFKDVIPRFKTMQGYRVPRVAGWDTHGLPVELEVEKKLGLKSKKEIENFGVVSFNQKCKESVLEYIDLWKQFTERIGYWADFDRAYFTFNNRYIESVWGIVGKVNDKKLLYKDYKVVPWCARCGTGLSSHELAQGYQDVSDISLYVKFKISNPEKIGLTGNVFLLAWTTTPWTLPGNVALAVGGDIEYFSFPKDGNIFIASKDAWKKGVFGENGNMVFEKTYKGSDLVGLSYKSIFPYLEDNLPEGEKPKLANAFKVYAGDFVTTTDGTGIVHIAPMYGQDDFELGTKNNLPKFHVIGDDGMYKEFCDFLSGRFVKEKDEAGKPTLDVDIIKYLQEKEFYFNKENYKHSYPHCWRCKTPLIYFARDSWYIRMSELRDKLVEENKHIHWEPDYIKEGRFGEWLREVKDWAISRERYWGTPLPIWTTEKGEITIISSINDLKQHAVTSGNSYRLMRHGKTDKNAQGVWDFDIKNNTPLNEEGIREVKATAEKLKQEGYKPDIVFVSPFLRTEETMKIVCDALNISADHIKEDSRLVEWNPGEGWEDKSIEEYFDVLYKEAGKTFHYHALKGGESFAQIVKRAGEFMYEIESTYQGKNILIVSHAAVLKALFALNNVYNTSQMAEFHNSFAKYKNAEIKSFDFVPLPHNNNFELDLHKPYIDEVKLRTSDGKVLTRVKEVMDVWFDSGAMPFAQKSDERKDNESFDEFVKHTPYPADFISEAIDQTRGWFYTLHAVGVLMDRGVSYKNVICLGHLLDKNGKKMSKSLGNVVNPWEQMDKYGIDAIRLWMYSVNQPGESKNYDEKTVDEINKKVFNLINNVHSFYELYRDKNVEGTNIVSDNVLDLWILTRLQGLTKDMTRGLEAYELLTPVRNVRDFVDDLSTWYLRRSRDRIKEGDENAKATLYKVLKTLAKLLAPFAPFFAEDLYQKLRHEKDAESVHLEEWPVITVIENNQDIESKMQTVRTVVTNVLEQRQKANIKVRQPLGKVSIKGESIGVDFEDVIKDEVNVKTLVFDATQADDIVLNTTIIPELQEEGIVRDIIRKVQDMRKTRGLMPKDRIVLIIETEGEGETIISNKTWQSMIMSVVGADDIKLAKNDGEVLSLENLSFKISL